MNLRQILISLPTAIMAILGFAAIWGGASLLLGRPAGWMSLVAAIDVAVLLRLAGQPANRQRAITAVLTTAATILAGAYVVAAVRIGGVMNTPPHEAVWRTGIELAITWWRMNGGWLDVVCASLALPAAWHLSR